MSLHLPDINLITVNSTCNLGKFKSRILDIRSCGQNFRQKSIVRGNTLNDNMIEPLVEIDSKIARIRVKSCVKRRLTILFRT